MLLLLVCTLAGIAGGLAYEQGNVAALPMTCKTRLDQIYENFYSIDVLPGTVNCTDIIMETLDNKSGVNCSAPEDIRGCFNYAYKPWTNFVRDCELFTLAPTCTNGRPCNKPVSDSPWWLRSLTLLWRPVTYDYGTGVVPNKGDGWQYYADEGEGTRRRYRRLFAEGEGGAVGGSAGCFPDFYTPQDFENWLQGNFQSPVYVDQGASSVPIIMWIVHAASILSMSLF
ncbi:g9898 [Coccomyxa elongata]